MAPIPVNVIKYANARWMGYTLAMHAYEAAAKVYSNVLALSGYSGVCISFFLQKKLELPLDNDCHWVPKS